MERCGKRNAVNSGSESWTGIGVVAGFGAVVLIMQWPYGKNGDVTWESELLQRLQKVRANCKTRNQLKLVYDFSLKYFQFQWDSDDGCYKQCEQESRACCSYLSEKSSEPAPSFVDTHDDVAVQIENED